MHKRHLRLASMLLVGALLGCTAPDGKAVWSRRVKQQFVPAGPAAVFAVTAADSPELAGTLLEIPEGSLARDTTITIDSQPEAIAQSPHTAAGPVAVLGPAGLVFQNGARLSLPFHADAGSLPHDLFVEVLEESGARRQVAASALRIDSGSGLATFTIAGFTSFQVAARGCDPTNPCSDGSACVAGRCRESCDGGCHRPPGSCLAQTGDCDPATDTCRYSPAPPGAACDDGIACTSEDACDGMGNCLGVAACSANQRCTPGGACECVAGHSDCDRDPANGCEHAGSCASCAPESDADFCARLDKRCGQQLGIDNCGAPRSVASCGECAGAAEVCDAQAGRCACAPEPQAQLCARLQKTCGPASGRDNCGADRTGIDCGTCSTGQHCDAGACVPDCIPESDTAFCLRSQKECGTYSGTDNCGSPRAVDCGACVSPEICDADRNLCVQKVCGPSDPCQAFGVHCGKLAYVDTCAAVQSVDCGGCPSGQLCSAATWSCVRCVPELDFDFCARLGKNCGEVTALDNCGLLRTVASCGNCGTGQVCSASTRTCVACTPETDYALCARLGKTCGEATATDNCGAMRTVPSCGTCALGQVCAAAINTCVACTPESNRAFCARLGKACGPVTASDNCGWSRTVSDCGSCAVGQSCEVSTNTCVACPGESDAALCARLAKVCGPVTATDICGRQRTVASCGSCPAGDSCWDGACFCNPETDAQYCARLGKACGTVLGHDNCGNSRQADCGQCQAGRQCIDNACVCAAQETDAQFCTRLAKQCGSVSDVDSCALLRTVDCGSCGPDEQCYLPSNTCIVVCWSDQQFCQHYGASCGTVRNVDNCSSLRTADCGNCAWPLTCQAGACR